MLSDADRQKAADLLMEAGEKREPVVQLSTTWPDIDFEDAYAIQAETTARRVAAGDPIVGHKVGLTSKAMQRSSQIDEPDYGHLHQSMLFPDGATLKHADFCIPRVEMELAFVLGEPLEGPGIGLLDVLRATEYVVPSIEVIDARVQNPRKIYDTISDNGAAAGLILGGQPVGPHDVDLAWVSGALYRNLDIEETGVAIGVLGHPAMGIAWLANKVGEHGTVLEPGHIVLSGSFVRPVWADPGDTLRADFGELGVVSIGFE